MKKYRLLKDIPGLKKGAIFEHRDYDSDFPDRGNSWSGVMILGWLDGDCQQTWAGETFIFPGLIARYTEWFKPIKEKTKKKTCDCKCKCCI